MHEAKRDQKFESTDLKRPLSAGASVPRRPARVPHAALAVGDREEPAVQVRELRALDGLLATREDVALVRKPSTRVASSALRSRIPRWTSVGVDRDPFQRRPEVVLHLSDQRTGMSPEVEPCRLLGRHDRFPQTRVAGALSRSEPGGDVSIAATRS